MEREHRWVVIEGWEEGQMGCTAKWYEVFFGSDENVLELIKVKVVQYYEGTEKLLHCYFKILNVMQYEFHLSLQNGLGKKITN